MVGEHIRQGRDVREQTVDRPRGEGSEGFISPIRWSFEDAATPYEGDDECGCHILGADGITDLSFKFKMVEVIDILGLDAESVGAVFPLTVKGKLKEEEGGTPIRGKDCVRIVR